MPMVTATSSPTYTLPEEHTTAIIESAVQTGVERALAAHDEHDRQKQDTLEDEALG